MENEYYAIELEDYSVPPICSGCTKTYAGTKQLISEFMEALAASAREDRFDTLIDAYHAWLRGEPTGEVSHGCYCKCWHRFIRAAFWNLQRDSLGQDFVPAGHRIWGHPRLPVGLSIFPLSQSN